MEETSKDGVDSVQSNDAAISEDFLAAEILMQLSERKPTPKPLRWGFRQPRSRQILRSGVLQAKEMEASRARASPTTPLSWSGGSSGSADGCEELSRSRKRLAGVIDDEKSKITVNEVTPLRLSIRRTKKKTYAELKKEVDMLLLEKSNLKKEFESLDNACKDLRVKNEGLKKLQFLFSFTAAGWD
ncbi:uncharacterized protein LOC131216914 isoform X2 [Magnolia sinica]|uniref:uncharacterized protein LOC131216914 isoform X2 n=1 Tax=Magnolia sinica TaxID=86752 RepID=UPI00265A4CA6|nr:uncharacterized protein LOC131216914 isoform X2 [Magnolia sinica]